MKRHNLNMGTALLRSPLVIVILAIAITFTSIALIKTMNELANFNLISKQEMSAATLNPAITMAYQNSPYLASASWMVFLMALSWKGRTRVLWQKRGHDYDTFKIMARMRGSAVRLQILNTLQLPKNRLQLANELRLDWKTIDGHVSMLMGYNLVEEMTSIGTAKYLIITKKGTEVLNLLKNNESDPNQNDSVGNNN